MVVAQPPRMNCGLPMRGVDRNAVIERLDLNEKQESQFKQLRSDREKKNIELHAKIQTARLALRDLFDEEQPDQDKIESRFTEISKAQNELKMSAIGFWFNVNKILTKEQQKLWKEHSRMVIEQGQEGRPPMGPGMPGRRNNKGMLGHGRYFNQQMDEPDDQEAPPEN